MKQIHFSTRALLKVATCSTLLCMSAFSYGWEFDGNVFTCEIKPVAASNSQPRWIYVSSDAMVQRNQYSQTELASVGNGRYVFLDPVVQRCSNQNTVGDGFPISSLNCPGTAMPSQQVWRLVKNNTSYQFINELTGAAIDTYGKTGNYEYLLTFHKTGTKNQLHYLQNCKNQNGNGASPAPY